MQSVCCIAKKLTSSRPSSTTFSNAILVPPVFAATEFAILAPWAGFWAEADAFAEMIPLHCSLGKVRFADSRRLVRRYDEAVAVCNEILGTAESPFLRVRAELVLALASARKDGDPRYAQPKIQELFLQNPNDSEMLRSLTQVSPKGWLRKSSLATKSFPRMFLTSYRWARTFKSWARERF